jgi:hypothetical protein
VSRFASFAARATVVLVSVLATCVAGEISIRALDLGVPLHLGAILERTKTAQEKALSGGAPRIFALWQPDDALGWRLRPSARLDLSYLTHYENKLAETNRHGMLDLEPAPEKKPVFVLGDSFVEGLLVPHERHFCTRLEQIFRRHEFMNLGVSGYGSVQSYLHLSERLAQLRPAYVIFALYVGNDFDDNDPFRNNAMVSMPGYRRVAIPFLSSAGRIAYGSDAYSSLALWAAKTQLWLVTERGLENAGLWKPPGFEVALKIIEKVRDDLAPSGVPFSVLLIPDDRLVREGTSTLHSALVEALAAEQVHAISLLEPFRATGRKTMGYSDANGRVIDPHWDSATHGVAASAIAVELRGRL